MDIRLWRRSYCPFDPLHPSDFASEVIGPYINAAVNKIAETMDATVRT